MKISIKYLYLVFGLVVGSSLPVSGYCASKRVQKDMPSSAELQPAIQKKILSSRFVKITEDLMNLYANDPLPESVKNINELYVGYLKNRATLTPVEALDILAYIEYAQENKQNYIPKVGTMDSAYESIVVEEIFAYYDFYRLGVDPKFGKANLGDFSDRGIVTSKDFKKYIIGIDIVQRKRLLDRFILVAHEIKKEKTLSYDDGWVFGLGFESRNAKESPDVAWNHAISTVSKYYESIK